MQLTHKLTTALLPTLLLAPFVTSCSSGGGDGPAPVVPPVPPGTNGLDLSGTWNMSDSVNASACGEGTYPDNYSLQVQQNGSALSVTSQDGTFNGSVNGNQVSWTGSYYSNEDEGMVAITGMNVTAASDGNSISGSASWTYSGDDGSFCAGTTQVSGVRAGGQGSNSGGSDVAGSWEIYEYIDDTACGGTYDDDSYTVLVEQSGSELTVNAPSGTFYGSIENGVINYSGSYYDTEDEGWVNITSLQLSVSTSGNELEGFSYWNYQGDDGTYCAGTTDVYGNRAGFNLEAGPSPQTLVATHLTVRESEDLLVTRLGDEVKSYEQLDLIDGKVTRAIRFTGAGVDEAFFTADDEIGGYLEVDHTDCGVARLESLGGPGPDGQWFSADDRVSSVVEIQRGSKCELAVSTSLGAPGPDGLWGTVDDQQSQVVER